MNSSDPYHLLKELFGIRMEDEFPGRFADWFAKEYGIGSPVILSVAHGEGIVLKLSVDGGLYALKIIPGSHDADLLNCYFFHISVGRLPVPVIVPDREGRLVGRRGRLPVVLAHWHEGVNGTGIGEYGACVAETLLRIHDSCAGFLLSGSFPLVPGNYRQRLNNIPILLRELQPSSFQDEMVACFAPLMDRYMPLAAEWDASEKDIVLTHEELRADNIFWDGAGISCILDWDGSRRQPRIDSIAQTALWNSLNPKNNHLPAPGWREIERILHFYERKHPIAEIDRNIFPALVLLHIARTASFWPEQFYNFRVSWRTLLNEIRTLEE